MKISVKVIPQAKENRVIQLSDNSFKVYTTKPATENKANDSVIVLLAKHLRLRKSQVFLVAGSTTKEKIFEII